MSKPRRSWVRAGRALWGGLALVALALLGLTSLLSARAEESAEIDARQRAERAAAAVLLGELSPRLASGDIVGAERRDLLEAVRSRILNDDRVARVRIWSTDGELIFSSTTRDDVSAVIAEDHLQFSQAAGGVPASVTVDATETAGPLLQTFVPLRIPDGVAPYAVAEIDQRYDAIRAEANRIWRPVQIGLVVALGAVAVLFALSFVSRRAARPAGERVPSREVEEGAPAADEGVRAAEPATFLAEPLALPAEPVVPPAQPVTLPAEPVTLPAEPFALPAGPVAVTPEERSADAERPQPEVSAPQIPPDVLARIDELEMQLRAEVAEREHFGAEVQRLRSGIDEREVELAGAKQGAAASEAERSRSAGQVAEATRRVAEAEKRAKEAEKQAAAADKRAEKVERAKRDHGSKVAEDLHAAQLETKALKQKLAEVEGSLADANARLADRKRAAPESDRTPAAAPETASAGLEVELLRAERDVATADLARTRRELETTRAELDDARARVAEMEAPPRDEIT